MGMSLEEMYKLAMNPKIYPDQRLLAVMQGHDSSLPMAVAMSAKQMRDKQEIASKGAQAKMQAAQPSVRDQMVAKGMQQHQMAGLDQLPAPTMEAMGEEGMAGGGLVSFGIGGFNDPDDQDNPEQDEQDELDAMMAQHGDLGGLGAGIMAVANPKAAKYSSFTSVTKPADAAHRSFNEIAAEAAKKHGASLGLVQHVMQKETGGHKDPANAVSKAGATGVMQLMPRTAKELGVQNITDPYENIHGGVKYIAQLEQKYRDPKLAAMAYNWGPGNVDKWLKRGGNEKAVPKETRMYVSSLAQGGHVKHYVTGDLVQSNFGEAAGPDVRTNQIVDDFGNVVEETRKKGPKLSPYERLKGMGIGGIKNALKVSAVPSAVYEGGKYATNAAANTLRGNPQMAKAYFGSDYSDPGGDNALAYNILQNADPTKKDLSSLGLEYYGSDSPQAQAERAAAAKNPTPAINPTPTNTGGVSGASGATDKNTEPTAPVTPKDTSQDYLTRYLANLESDRKQNAGLSAILAGLTTAGTAGPLSSALSKGAQTGIGAYADMQKGNQTAMAQGLAAQAAANRNAIYQQHYLGEPTELRTLRAVAADPKLAQLYKGMGKTQQISRQDALKEFNDLMPTQQKKYKDFNDYYNQVNGIMPVYQTADVGAKIRPQ
jgi:hypothetical protein